MTGSSANGTTPAPGTEPKSKSWHETFWAGEQFEYLTLRFAEIQPLDYYGTKGWKLVTAYLDHTNHHILHFVRDAAQRTITQRRKPGIYHDGVAGNIRVKADGSEEALGDF